MHVLVETSIYVACYIHRGISMYVLFIVGIGWFEVTVEFSTIYNSCVWHRVICIVTPYVTLVHFKWNILGSLLICCNQCDLVQCPQLVEADQWRRIYHGPGNQSSPASCLTILSSSSAIISGGEDGRLCVGSLPVCHDSWWVTRVGSVEPGSQYDAGASIVMPVFGWNWNSQFPASNQSDCQILGVTNSIWPRKRKIFLLHLWHSHCQRHYCEQALL